MPCYFGVFGVCSGRFPVSAIRLIGHCARIWGKCGMVRVLWSEVGGIGGIRDWSARPPTPHISDSSTAPDRSIGPHRPRSILRDHLLPARWQNRLGWVRKCGGSGPRSPAGETPTHGPLPSGGDRWTPDGATPSAGTIGLTGSSGSSGSSGSRIGRPEFRASENLGSGRMPENRAGGARKSINGVPGNRSDDLS